MSAAVFVVLVTLSISSGCWAGCQCPSDTWYSMEGVGCFKYFDVAKTFMDAEAACHDYSPTAGKIVHLASIHSAEEHNALIAMVPEAVNVWDPHVFIGLRLKDGVTPAWTDGSFYDYQNWCGADPNAHPAGDGCISGGFCCLGSWVDVPTGENRAYPFICKSPCF